MSRKRTLGELLEYTRQQLMQFSGLLGLEELDRTGETEAWAAKDELFHSLVWAERRLEILESLEREEALSEVDYGDFNAANREIFEEYQHSTWEDASSMLQRIYQRIDAYLARSDEDALDQTPPGDGRTIWRMISDSFVLHPMIHLWGYLVKNGHAELLEDIYGASFADQLLKLDDSDVWKGMTNYNLACIAALTGSHLKAIDLLTIALRMNPGLVEWSRQDTDLDAIRDLPEFQAIYAGLKEEEQ